VEIAHLSHDDPHLKQDRHLAMWWAKIVTDACKHARSFLNRIFPENKMYTFFKLPIWRSVLPWIRGAHTNKSQHILAPSTADADMSPPSPVDADSVRSVSELPSVETRDAFFSSPDLAYAGSTSARIGDLPGPSPALYYL